MSAEDNKALIRGSYAAISSGNLDEVAQLAAPDYVDHAAPPGLPPGPEGVKQSLTMFRTAFPDLEIQAEDLIADGDKVAARVVIRGTQHGDFQGIPATGKQVTVTGIELFRIANGKIAERWAEVDRLSMLQQLGAIPTPGQAAADANQDQTT